MRNFFFEIRRSINKKIGCFDNYKIYFSYKSYKIYNFYVDAGLIFLIFLCFTSLWVNVFSYIDLTWLENFLAFNLDALGILTNYSPGKIQTPNILIITENTITGGRCLQVILILSLIYGAYSFDSLCVRLLHTAMSLFCVLLVNKLRLLLLVIYFHYYVANDLSFIAWVPLIISWSAYIMMLLMFYFIGNILKVCCGHGNPSLAAWIASRG